MKELKFSVIAAFAAILTACATGHDVPRIGKMLGDTTGQNGRACIWLNDIQGYGVLKNNVVSIDSRRGYYLATFLPGCNDLQTSARILFSGNFGEICGQTMNKIVTGGGDHCTVNQIFEFKDRAEAFSTYNSVLEERQALMQGSH